MKIAVLLACHNRKISTLECLKRLSVAAAHADLEYQIYLFDDGSTDGTVEAVLREHPESLVERGDGNQFWNRSMHAVFDTARKGDHPFYLWLNDDTMLAPEALRLMLDAQSGAPRRIVVGAVCDTPGGAITYGGMRRVNPLWRPFLYRLVPPTGQPEPVDVMNGNVVLIPRDVATLLGNIEYTFEHGMGDIDYALRATRSGCQLLQTAEFVGTCSRNSVGGTHRDRNLPVRQRIRYAFSKKGLPLMSWSLMCWRHGGMLFPIHFVWGYLRIILMKVN